MKGFYKRSIVIDLTSRRFQIEPIDDDTLFRHLGGKGIASHLLYRINPPKIDPLAPDNTLIFATGPVAGSRIWGSSRYGVYTKSPQTGYYSESYAGGKAPEAIDAVGFDTIAITGKSRHPLILLIHPEGVEFHDAADIWGKETYDTEDSVRALFSHTVSKSEKSGALVIGPAGEKRVRFAVIENDYWRSAGRTGVGAVMGSKNLKAIFFKGDRKRTLHDPEGVKQFSRQIAEECKDHPVVRTFKTLGTPNMVKITNMAGAFPTRYWSLGTFDKWEKISAEALHTECKVTPHACAKCFIACGRLTTLKNGRHAGLQIEGPEYETIFAFGGLCMVEDINEIAYLNDICDRLGMDTISAGNLCAFAMEASLRKAIDYKIDYGDVDGISKLLHAIAKREGIGDVLADGIKTAAEKWNLQDLAVHVKGLDLPGYDPRVLKGCGLAFSTSPRGACHLRATFHNPELKGKISPGNIPETVGLFMDYEDRLIIMDALILCRFFRSIYPWDRLSEILRLVCGIDEDRDQLRKRAAFIANLVRQWNIREGLSPADDVLPKRLFREKLESGHSINEEDVKHMVNFYYRLRGWNEGE
ncbi:MAG: aldehyde ferredoxin oxidoreductase family protein [Pseudomonadota bacterium]